jgi:GNAT superfamily N-acetyltransferase
MSDLVSLMDLRIRPATEGDMGYVIDSWGRSLRAEYPEVRTRDFVGVLREGIKRRINKEEGEVSIAYPGEDPSLIIGWSVLRVDGLIHFIYVREPYRRAGVARFLLDRQTTMAAWIRAGGVLACDAMTDSARQIRASHPDRIRYIPTI